MKIATIEVELLGHYGSDLEVVNSARVSFNKRANTMSPKDEKLIKYLADHKHHSPFNHAFLSFRVKCPLYVAAQLHKHAYMPVNSVSRRYVQTEPEYFKVVWRQKADNVKQGSGGPVSPWKQEDADFVFQELCKKSIETYHYLLDAGICEEQARRALLVDAATEFVWSGSLGAVLNMLSLRLDEHAQAETREVAEKIAVYVKNLFPVSYNAYLPNASEATLEKS